MTRTTVYWPGADGRLHTRIVDAVIPAPPPPAPPKLPTAIIRVSSQVDLAISVSGSASTAVSPAGIIAWVWSWGDGSPNSRGANPSHTYTSPGAYDVVLTVTDSNGLSSSTKQSVRVTAPVVVNKKPLVPDFTATPDQPGGVGFFWTFTALSTSDPDGQITRVVIGYGDGGADSSSATDAGGLQLSFNHRYAAAGTYNTAFTAYDNSGDSTTVFKTIAVLTPNQAPIIKMAAPVVNGMSVTFSVTGSYDPDGTIVRTDWDFGDGGKGSGPTVSHTYAASGPWTVTATCTDDRGAIAQQTVTAAPSAGGGGGGTSTGSAVVSPWTTGSPTEGMIANAPVYRARDLAGGASTLELQTLINNMPGPGYIDVSNEQVFMSSFGNGAYPNAAGSSTKFYGLIGGVVNGSFNNQVTLRANAMTRAQADAIQAQQTAFQTSQGAVIRTASSGPGGSALPTYFMGVHLVGADQPSVTENTSGANAAQFSPAPARMKGLDLDLAANGSILQNSLLEGFGAADGSVPPWEVGSVDSRRSNGLLVRRTEISGILPVGSPSRPNSSSADPYGRGWRRSGGFQWNADKSPVMSYVSLHDTLVSGLTASIAGTSNNGSNNTQNPKFDHLYLANNSQKGFPGINLENVIGPMEFNYCTFIMNGTGGWHISLVNSTSFGTVVGDAQVIIREPTWRGLGFNGMFTVRIVSWGGTQKTAPTVIVGGKTLTATTSTTADPANYYCIRTS